MHGHSFLASVQCAPLAGWSAFAGGEVQQLRTSLQDLVAELDYTVLNTRIAAPSNANVARWLQARMRPHLPQTSPAAALGEQIRVQSTADEGLELTGGDGMQVWRRYTLQTSHRLPYVPVGHKCGRMHGHSFAIVLHARHDPASADNDATAHALDALWQPLHRLLDMQCLNAIEGLENPTSELLSSWLWDRMHVAMPALARVSVYETASCGASYDGHEYTTWKDFTLDSALRLRHAPEDSALRRVHGHTYTVRLVLRAPLDPRMGWTLDFGDVKTCFSPVFQELDHQSLHEIADLPDCDSATLAAWILRRARAGLPQLQRVDLFETPGCGASAYASSAAVQAAN